MEKDAKTILAAQKYYNQWKEEYEKIFVLGDELYRSHYQIIKYYLSCCKGVLFDAGCGYGRFLPLSKKFSLIVGLDISSGMLKIAKSLTKNYFINNVELVQGDLAHLPFRDTCFQNTMCLYGVLYHVPNVQKCIEELKRVTKSKIITSVYNFIGYKGWIKIIGNFIKKKNNLIWRTFTPISIKKLYGGSKILYMGGLLSSSTSNYIKLWFSKLIIIVIDVKD